MGRLFWKFFLSYWAALLVAVVGVGATAVLVQLTEEDRALSLESGPRAALILGSAAATASHGGLPALRELMEDLRRREDAQVFAVDEDGRELLGRAVPADALAHARESLRAGVESQRARRVQLTGSGAWLIFIPIESAPFWTQVLLRAGPPTPLLPLAVGALASLVFGALLAWYVARPIRLLRGAFASLSQGHLDTRVAPLMARREANSPTWAAISTPWPASCRP